MLKDFIIVKTVLSFLVPYVFLYAIYIQLNGEVSPGGGFQAGVIFASGIIAFDLIQGKIVLRKFLTNKALITCSLIGVLLYALTGLVGLFFNENYLNYNVLAPDDITGQHLGIFIIELGGGLTVSSVMSLIYTVLREDY
jgi:multicomponent Na+:H+ antiporter subunit B